MPRLFLLDGTALAYRAHFAMAASGLRAPDGTPTGATYGFALTLRRILEQESPERIAVAFDPPGPTFRHAKYEPYKATRQKAPEEMVAQFPLLKEIVLAHGVPLYEVAGFEADDVIGTLAVQGAAAGYDVLIVTGDKDFMQLVGPRIRLYNVFKKGEELVIEAEEAVREKFGTTPDRVVEVLAIMGDSSDNVPGVHGIGEKGAIKLIGEFGSVAGVLERLGEVKGRARELVERDREQLLLSRDLVTIRTDVPLEPAIAELPPPAPRPEALLALFKRLGFQSLVAKLVPTAPGSAERGAAERRDYRTVRSRVDLMQLSSELRAAGVFAVDTETTSVSPSQAEIVGVSFSAQPGRAWYVPFNLDPPVLAPPGQEPRRALLEALAPLLTDPALRRFGQNTKYDWIVFACHGLDLPPPDFDTMVASFCAAGSTRRHNLDLLALEFLGLTKIPTTDLIGSGKDQITMDQVPVDRVAEYACEDADVTFRLRPLLEKELEEKGGAKLFAEQELPLVTVLARMEERGIRVDVGQLAAQSKDLEAELERLVHAVQELAGRNFNVNSTKALGEVLFEELKIQDAAGVKRVRRTQTGWATDAETLESQYGDVPIVRKLLEYRELSKLKSTYLDALPRFVNPRTGRVHGSFSQVTAATGRLSSSDPNLQNIPIRTERGRRIRGAFVAREPDGHGPWVLLSADYSQIELRVMAHLSGDERMRGAFARGEDIHASTAAAIFDVLPGLVTREMRAQAKVINFGLLYGMGPQRLARETGMTLGAARAFIEKYFATFPRVRVWIDATLARARETGSVETLLGHRRAFPDLKSADPRARAFAENAAVNTPVQGSAADIIKRAMIRLEAELGRRGLATQLLLQVHDELVLEVPERELEAARACVVECMERAVELAVPLVVECGHGKSWLEAH
jgi:DNA polymerase-1